MVLLTVILMDLLTGTEFDLFVPSFPELQSHFNLSPFWVEALLSINFVGYFCSMFFVGSLADRFGRKPIIMLGLMIFVIGSVFCVCAPSYYLMLFGRLLQGIGVAAPAIISFLIIADTYPLKEQQFLMAMLNGSMNAAAAAAPVAGSYITLYYHWRGNFTALLMLGLITLIMTILFVPRYELPKNKELLSFNGYTPIFHSKPLILLIVNIIFTFVPYWIFVGMSPLLYIRDLGVSLYHFGYYQGVLALVFAAGSVIYGLLLKNYDWSQKKMLYVSIQIFVASVLMLAFVAFTKSVNPLLITFAMLLFVTGQIIPSTILYPLSLNFMPHAKGRISAIIQGGRLILAALGLQMAGYLYVGSFQNIGIILIGFITMIIVTLILVVENRQLVRV